MRVALGASRSTLVRQLLTESVLLAALGAALGTLVAIWGVSFIASRLPDGIPRLQEAQVDAPALVFTLAVSVLTGLLFGLAPALQASRPSLTEGLKEGDRGSSGRRQRLRSVLVVGEVALTLTLLVGAGLLVQSFRRVLQVDPGFKAQNLSRCKSPSTTPTVSRWRTSSNSCNKTSADCLASNRSRCRTGFPLARRTSRRSSLKAERRPRINLPGCATT